MAEEANTPTPTLPNSTPPPAATSVSAAAAATTEEDDCRRHRPRPIGELSDLIGTLADNLVPVIFLVGLTRAGKSSFVNTVLTAIEGSTTVLEHALVAAPPRRGASTNLPTTMSVTLYRIQQTLRSRKSGSGSNGGGEEKRTVAMLVDTRGVTNNVEHMDAVIENLLWMCRGVTTGLDVHVGDEHQPGPAIHAKKERVPIANLVVCVLRLPRPGEEELAGQEEFAARVSRSMLREMNLFALVTGADSDIPNVDAEVRSFVANRLGFANRFMGIECYHDGMAPSTAIDRRALEVLSWMVENSRKMVPLSLHDRFDGLLFAIRSRFLTTQNIKRAAKTLGLQTVVMLIVAVMAYLVYFWVSNNVQTLGI